MERQFTFVMPYAEKSHLLRQPAALNAACAVFYSSQLIKKSPDKRKPAKRFLSLYCLEVTH